MHIYPWISTDYANRCTIYSKLLFRPENTHKHKSKRRYIPVDFRSQPKPLRRERVWRRFSGGSSGFKGELVASAPRALVVGGHARRSSGLPTTWPLVFKVGGSELASRFTRTSWVESFLKVISEKSEKGLKYSNTKALVFVYVLCS